MNAAATPRLLVIDDDRAFARDVTQLANRLGLDVDHAANAADIDVLLGQGHDLVMLDLVLSDTDGLRVLRDLRDRQPGANVALVSSADPAVLNSARRVAQMNGFNVVGALPKPVTTAQLDVLLRFRPDPTTNTKVVDPLLRSQVLQALDERAFRLLYQPMLSIPTSEVTGAEALVRLSGPGLATVSPSVFVAIYEQEGRSRELLDAVMLTAAEDRRRVPALNLLDDVSINISVLDLADNELPERAADILSVAAAPSRWTLEITDTTEAMRLTDALDVLTRLRLKGFQLAMDDFGSGSATLERLRNYPFTELKVDRRVIGEGADDATRVINLFWAAADLGSALNLRVVAEGLETPQELLWASQAGCDVAQGYFIGKPVAAEALDDALVYWKSTAILS